MTGQLPPATSDRRHSPILLPAIPHVVPKQSWLRRRSPSTLIGGLLLILAIGAGFVYAFRVEAAFEATASGRSR